MRHRLLTLLCSIALLASAIAWAHEGHARKVMGTVTMPATDHLMVKTTDGKDETITLNAKTKVVRGKTAIKSADIKPGTRVVVIVQSDKAPLVATEVQIGTVENRPLTNRPRPHSRLPARHTSRRAEARPTRIAGARTLEGRGRPAFFRHPPERAGRKMQECGSRRECSLAFVPAPT